MRYFITRIVLLVISLLPLFSLEAQKVVRIVIDGAINPVVAEYVQEGIAEAEAKKASCILINLNTPGGLLTSTRKIVGSMMKSKVPVVVYVTPEGAHAGSAGVFITLAAHVAAMAPGTNLGSAHPVNMNGGMDSIMGEKVTNDAAAFIRSIAEKRGRNMEWAEDAVRFSVSLAETEAVKKNVVNLVAANEAYLLRAINGLTIDMEDRQVVLNTATAEVVNVQMSWIQKILNYASDPNVAYVLMLLGIYGLIFEFYNPGIGFPGVVGGISLILALYAMNTLPINVAGLALIILAIVLFILELTTPTNGILSIGAVISLTLGSMMLIKPGTQFQWAKISLGVIIPSIIVTALFFLVIIGYGLRAQRNKIASGADALLDETGEALSDIDPTGSVRIQGEIWKAESVAGLIVKGAKIKVKQIKGLLLIIEPLQTT